MTIPVGAMIGAGALQGIGSFLGGNQQQKANAQQTKESARQYNLSGWMPAEHSAETAGLRDKLLALFGQIAGGGGPQAFQPRDAFNPTQGPGGQTMAPAQGQMGGMGGQLGLNPGYKMGDGGVNPDVAQHLLYMLGYHPQNDFRRQQQGAKDAQGQAQYNQSLQPRPQMPVPPGPGGSGGMFGGVPGRPGGRGF